MGKVKSVTIDTQIIINEEVGNHCRLRSLKSAGIDKKGLAVTIMHTNFCKQPMSSAVECP